LTLQTVQCHSVLELQNHTATHQQKALPCCLPCQLIRTGLWTGKDGCQWHASTRSCYGNMLSLPGQEREALQATLQSWWSLSRRSARCYAVHIIYIASQLDLWQTGYPVTSLNGGALPGFHQAPSPPQNHHPLGAILCEPGPLGSCPGTWGGLADRFKAWNLAKQFCWSDCALHL